MWRDLFQPSHLIIVAVLVVILFGWKRLPDAARSVGRSMRIFKSEVSEMKNDGKESKPSPAASDTVRGDVVPPQQPAPSASAPQVSQTRPTDGYPQQAAPQEPAPATQDRSNGSREPERFENPAL